MKVTKITPIGIKNNRECDLSDPEATPAFMIMVSAWPEGAGANKNAGVFIVAHNRVYNFIVEVLGREYTIDQYLDVASHSVIHDHIKDDGELVVMLGGPVDGPYCKEILRNVKDFCDML